MGVRIGIDLGGTKIELLALDESGTERLRRRAPTPRGDYAATLRTVALLVSDAERELNVRATVGVGIPGALSLATGLVKNANSTWLIGKPLKEDLQSLLAREVQLANDANCFALSEAVDGAGRGAELVFGVILGTGVGGGIVVRRELVTGADAIAGEWGHNPLPLPQSEDLPLPACYCGRPGCIETYLSGPAMAREHRTRTGESLDPAQIAARAVRGDAQCEATLARYEERLARSLATVINILDPHIIVLGGGLSNLDRLYERIPRRWGRYVFSDRVATRLVRNAHGDSSGVRGAAWLWGGPPGKQA
ncbi:MAG: ROK family protein [Betaproteobacteria bacterium]|nr:ROK family protein [Betaproteobacteria bacterium]